MIIDFHTHVFPDQIAGPAIAGMEKNSGLKAAASGTAAGLLESMERGGIALSVLAPVVTAPRQFDSINRFSDSLRSSRLEPFGGIHPDCEDIKGKLKALKAAGMKGVKVHPDYQNVFFNDIRYKRIVSEAAELGLYTLVHAGKDPAYPVIHCTPKMAAEVLSDTQSDKVILAHLGGYESQEQAEEYLFGRQVYLDTAVIQYTKTMEEFSEAVRLHGAEKILFGTDSPWYDQKKAVEWILKCSLTDEEKQNILGKNAAKILEKMAQ